MRLDQLKICPVTSMEAQNYFKEILTENIIVSSVMKRKAVNTGCDASM
jgi:hypothetical protein